MKKNYVLKEDELYKLVDEFLESFKNGVVILRGDLASGKTTLVKSIAKTKGVVEDVTSPTFSLQHIYAEGIYHYDLYNKGLDHFISLGLLEELEKEGLHFIEWGDEKLEKLLKDVGIDVAVIKIDKMAFDKREYEICIN
jgi:tRNA threonylcarbamoyladenosine biosynthesis protein TsaE